MKEQTMWLFYTYPNVYSSGLRVDVIVFVLTRPILKRKPWWLGKQRSCHQDSLWVYLFKTYPKMKSNICYCKTITVF